MPHWCGKISQKATPATGNGQELREEVRWCGKISQNATPATGNGADTGWGVGGSWRGGNRKSAWRGWKWGKSSIFGALKQQLTINFYKIMKKLISLAAAFAALISLTSCEDVLEKLPINYWYCGEEMVIAKAGSAEIISEAFFDTPIKTIKIYPTATGLDAEVIYMIGISDEDWAKAMKGETLAAKSLLIEAYSAKGKDVYMSALGSYCLENNVYDRHYTFDKTTTEATVKLSLNGTYFTMTVEYKSKATAISEDGTVTELPADKQFYTNLGCHYAGTAIFK